MSSFRHQTFVRMQDEDCAEHYWKEENGRVDHFDGGPSLDEEPTEDGPVSGGLVQVVEESVRQHGQGGEHACNIHLEINQIIVFLM